jgi:hypothetical protein
VEWEAAAAAIGGVDYPGHNTFLSTYLASALKASSYFSSSTNFAGAPDLITTATPFNSKTFCVTNGCVWKSNVIDVNGAVPGATVVSQYFNFGTNGPYNATVYAPSNATHPYVVTTSGFDIRRLVSRFDGNANDRLLYFLYGLQNAYGTICNTTGTPVSVGDGPQGGARMVDFLGNVWGNPIGVGGKATVHFGLAKADRVEVKVYDVSGRLVRTLADRNFPAGEQRLTWDGTNDQGRMVSRGVYFTQVKFINSRFVDAKKVTVLK